MTSKKANTAARMIVLAGAPRGRYSRPVVRHTSIDADIIFPTNREGFR